MASKSKLTHFYSPFLKSDILNDLLSLATNGKSATRKLYIQTKNALKTSLVLPIINIIKNGKCLTVKLTIYYDDLFNLVVN